MNDFLARVATSYCERIGDSIFSEPLNLLSNIAFFLSAFYAFKLLKGTKTESNYKVLVILLLFIGIGSALWHSFRHPYALLLDAVPIFVFFIVLLYFLLKKLFKSGVKAVVLLVTFICVQVTASVLLPDAFNGSIRHIINAIVFTGLSILIYKGNRLMRRDIVIALSLYVLAILSRSFDNVVCPYFPIGTHFLWHTLNAIAAYFAVKILLNVKPLKF